MAKYKFLFLALLGSILMSSCARMGSPDGGWFDEEPPHVVSASPADRTTNVTTRKVRINFNEFIKLDNPSEKVIVSPPQIQPPEIRTYRKSLIVELQDSLKPDMTYTIDFSDAITDNNESNPLGSYTYCFSTGEVIDTMEVSGYVLEAENLEPVKGIAVGIYPSDAPDSVFLTEPLLRITRTDSRGHFVIKGIAPGNYRAFALQDLDGDYAFSQKNEKIAFNRDVFTPSSKPDVRHDTIWRDTLHIDRILAIPYTHFLPDDIVLRAFTGTQTDRFLLKTERKEPDRLDFYFTYGDSILPEIKGLNFNSDNAFVVEASEQRDTLFYWLRDTTLINQDTLQMEMRFHATDTLGNLSLVTDTLEMIPKTPYARRLKQQQKAFEDWKKEQDKKKRRGQPYDSIMPVKPLDIKIKAPSQLDPDKNIFIDSPVPLESADTGKIHLYVKIDTLWYQARYELEQPGIRQLKLIGEWRPEQEYSLEIDSAAFRDIYGNVSKPFKQGIRVKGYDAYGTLLLTVPDLKGKHAVLQLLNSSGNPVKEIATDQERVQFSYIDPGTYFLRLFIDDNDNGVWDTGDYKENRQPEAVFYYHEPIECKAKWDLTLTWNLTSRPLFLQKPEKITKQKADKEKTVRSKNADRAKQLGIEYTKIPK